ncbi:MAG: glucose-1-phosphate cytidylyltransferase [Planctomycetota bacterium]|jgi:glucose-1-phosphate cytidylyltransferase|nr:glucose-1-phosphate cytidylyltransferase [Planctomycetota bacterium]
MKVVILAGGLGTRLSEETEMRPKPMVEIGDMPILWHIMKMYSHQGFNDFIILTGYKSHMIKDFFINYYAHYSDLTVDLAANQVSVHSHRSENWKVTILYTGRDTMTGGRLKRAENYIGRERFMLTYGDGVSDLDFLKLLSHHERTGGLATVTAVQPAGRFGSLSIDSADGVSSFREKAGGDGTWMSGGFFVMEPGVFDYLPPDDPDVILEDKPLRRLASDGKLNAYRFQGYWKSMDTLWDKMQLTDLLASGQAPWVKWQSPGMARHTRAGLKL